LPAGSYNRHNGIPLRVPPSGVQETLLPSMTRPSRPWLLPVVCAVLGIAWVLWLAHDSEPAGEHASAPAPVLPAATPSPPGAQADANPAKPRPEARPATVPSSAARAPDIARPSTPGPAQLAFQSPAGALVGDSFDVHVAINASRPIARIGVEVFFDPTLLKARALEEIDYGQRATGERAFRIDEIGEGRAVLTLVIKAGELPPNSAPVLQFEALAPGGTQIRVEGISVTDASGRAVPWSASGQESRISIN